MYHCNLYFRRISMKTIWSFFLISSLIQPVSHAQNFIKAGPDQIALTNSNSVGCSWADFDNDGDQDLFVTHGKEGGTEDNAFYLNDGDKTFSIFAGYENHNGFSESSSWGDFDNDGLLDLFVANSGWGTGKGINNLYHNNGNGTFTKITEGALVNEAANHRSCCWGDYDNDGFIDLFIACESGKNKLFKNNGDGTFTKITTGDVVNDAGSSVGCSWADYDNDGDLDLYVARMSNQKNLLYQNNGDGTFRKIIQGEVVNETNYSMGCSWGDYNNDGFLDLFVPNLNQKNALYRNRGDGTFEKILDGAIVNDVANSFGSCWGDFDNDGFLDLFVANWRGQNNAFYHNNGDGTFAKITTGAFVTDGGESEGCASADFDNDGDLDLFVANSAGQKSWLYVNQGNDSNWLNVKCIGSTSNRAALGAKINVKAKVDGVDRWQTREIFGQTGYESQNSLNVTFGLKNASVVDSLIVRWPSGIVQILTYIPVNQFLVITEKKEGSSVPPQGNAAAKYFRLAQNFPNPFNNSTTIEFYLPIQATARLQIFDLAGRQVLAFDFKESNAGYQRFNLYGNDLASGVYLYLLQAGGYSASQKFVLLK
jgi:hypothetical protein